VDWDARWLLRFDGVRFVRWTPPAGEHLPTTAVISLLGAADGSLWIGTASGLAQWKNGNLLNFPETVGRVNSIYEDREGTIWMARSRTQAGAVFKVTLSVAKCGATFHFALPAAPAPPSRLG
jgi:ligand-binding sensor domain-containing protein